MTQEDIQKILNAMPEGVWYTAIDIAKKGKLGINAVRRSLRKMRKYGEILWKETEGDNFEYRGRKNERRPY